MIKFPGIRVFYFAVEILSVGGIGAECVHGVSA